MHYKLRLWWRGLLVVSVVGVLLISIYRIPSAAGFVASSQQDVIRLETRLTQLEQRIYSIETNLRILEQQSRISGTSSRNVTQEDINRLRTEIQTLQNRLMENECGMAKLDERTLAPAKRGRVSAGDPCRLNFDLPLRLPSAH
jgi:cob(I)alamin adenosyltransferase